MLFVSLKARYLLVVRYDWEYAIIPRYVVRLASDVLDLLSVCSRTSVASQGSQASKLHWWSSFRDLFGRLASRLALNVLARVSSADVQRLTTTFLDSGEMYFTLHTSTPSPHYTITPPLSHNITSPQHHRHYPTSSSPTSSPRAQCISHCQVTLPHARIHAFTFAFDTRGMIYVIHLSASYSYILSSVLVRSIRILRCLGCLVYGRMDGQ